MRRRAVMVVALVGAGACYDFTLPDDDDDGSSTTSTSTATGPGGGNPFPPPCDQYTCNDCVTCTSALIVGDADACEAYLACLDACLGNSQCESMCFTSEAVGLAYFSSLRSQCTDSCMGDPPCR